jgi:threonine-phosphate decarboxylase
MSNDDVGHREMPNRETLASFYGGYWNDDVSDFRFMTNPFFPPQEFMQSLVGRLEELVTSYPSTNWYISELYSDIARVKNDQLVISNGASELIAAITDLFIQHIVIPIPTFDEFINRAHHLGRTVTCFDWKPGSDFDVQGYIETVKNTDANAALLIRPNNPTGSLISRPDIVTILDALTSLDVIIVDESFLEFSPNPNKESIVDLLDQYPNVLLLKSLSKIYGIPGLRLGYVASANQEWIQSLRNHLPIWGINSLAQYFLEQLPLYTTEFEQSCDKVRDASKTLFTGLSDITNLTSYPTVGNFVLCKVPDTTNSQDIANNLWENHHILINDCSGKAGLDESYIRLASRTIPANTVLIDAIAKTLQ